MTKSAFHTCPECEANFRSADGSIPMHSFNRKRCPGSNTKIVDGVTLYLVFNSDGQPVYVSIPENEQ